MGNYGFTVIDSDMKYINPSGAVIDVAEGGRGVVCVNFTLGEGDTVTSDKTYEEIVTAIEAGNYVYGVLGNSRLQMSSYIEDSEIWFSTAYIDTNVLVTETVVINSDDTVPIDYTFAAYDLSTLIVED